MRMKDTYRLGYRVLTSRPTPEAASVSACLVSEKEKVCHKYLILELVSKHSIHAVRSRPYILKTLWHNRAPVTIATGFVQLAKLIIRFQSFCLVGFSLLANCPHNITMPGPKRFRYSDAWWQQKKKPKFANNHFSRPRVNLPWERGKVLDWESWKCPRQKDSNANNNRKKKLGTYELEFDIHISASFNYPNQSSLDRCISKRSMHYLKH